MNEKAAENKNFDQKYRYWALLRDAIVHEDNLVNHRLTWLLTIEGFLFGGFFVIQNSMLSSHLTSWTVCGIEILMALIFMAAWWINYISGCMISAAYRQVVLIRHAWHKKYHEETRPPEDLPGWIRANSFELGTGDHINHPDGAEFPPIMGTFNYKYLSNSKRIPMVLLALNTIAIVVCFSIAVSKLCGIAFEQQETRFESEKTGTATKVKG